MACSGDCAAFFWEILLEMEASCAAGIALEFQLLKSKTAFTRRNELGG
jgi:hypothetical protein